MSKHKLLKVAGYSSLVMVIFTVLPVLADLDIQTPPGSPHEWDRVLTTPNPPGGYPVVSRGKKKESEKKKKGGTVTEKKDVPEPPEYSVGTLFDFYKFTTADAPNHLKASIPDPSEVDPPDISSREGTDVKKKKKSGDFPLDWNYQPPNPPELVMGGMAGSIRHNLHPEHNSAPEIVAHLIEMGYPTSIGVNSTSGYGSAAVSGSVSGISSPSGSAPDIPDSKDPFRLMVNRLAVSELISGYPFAFDPTYAKKILTLSDTARPSLIACAKSDHTFLRRNAVALLMKFRGENVRNILRKRMNDSDPVTRVRATKGLIRRYDKKIIDDLINMLDSGQAYMQSVAAYGLGYMKYDKAVDPLLAKIKSRKNDATFLWSALPAIARIPGHDKKILNVLNDLSSSLPGGDKQEVLSDMVDLGAAAHGSKKARAKLARKMRGNSGIKQYATPIRYLVIDVIERLGAQSPGAIKLLLNIIREDGNSGRVRSYAIYHLPKSVTRQNNIKNSVFGVLQSIALNNREPGQVRASCLLKLAHFDNKRAVKLAQKLAGAYGSGGGKLEGPEAFLFVKAIELAGGDRKLSTGLLKRCVKRAASQNAYARREVNDPSTPFTMIKPHPGLLERSLIELGRSAKPDDSDTLDLLEKVMKSNLKEGRGTAALAIGLVGGKQSALKLAEALKSDSGWVRCCAYLGLRNIVRNHDIFIDWIFSSRKKIAEKANEWKSWINNNM